MSTTDGFELVSSEEAAGIGFRKPRGEYKKKRVVPIESLDGFELLDEQEAEKFFALVAPSVFNNAPNRFHKDHERDHIRSITRQVTFVDGEGANHGLPTMTVREHGLTRHRQEQNYALLTATMEGAECGIECTGEDCPQYRSIVGANNHDQLRSVPCLEFLLGLPAEHTLVGYGLSYDVEHWLKDLPDKKMLELAEKNATWWRRYRIHYIPNKVFSISKYSKSTKEKKPERLATRTVYDIHGFFQGPFAEAIRKWEVGTEPEYQFIERMKKGRSEFGDITPETLAYNHMEGKHGVRLFKRVREEYTKLGLRIPRPVGAGSVATAMFRKHGISRYDPPFQPIPTEVMLQAYIGGRFDIARIGLHNTAYEYDINSAYPHIARTLPCLAHSRFEWTQNYFRDKHSLWLVRWRDNENRWSPFPYRLGGGKHIRYLSSGMGYYFGDEVASALQLDSDIDIVGGYKLICECDERPFEWLESYYSERQIMKANHDFGEIVVKLGCNSVYGKLAQTKGTTPRYQNLIWAGMITSGTRAMLMSAVSQNPEAVFKLATDAVFSSVPLELPCGPELGQWKLTEISDLLVLGNGIYRSRDGVVSKNRGYLSDPKYFDWNVVWNNFMEGRPSIVTKHEFVKWSGAYNSKHPEDRCVWTDEQQLLDYSPPEGKILERGWIWPGVNPTPFEISAPMKVKENTVREFGVGNSSELHT